MAFKIINPGYGYLVNPAFHTVRSTRYSPRFGISFYLKDSSGGYKGYTIPEIGYDGTLYFKFDVYVPDEKFSLLVGLGNSDYRHAWFALYNFPSSYHFLELIDAYGDAAISVDSEDYGDFLNFGAVNTIWVKLKLEDEYDVDGTCTIKVNGSTVGECTHLLTNAHRQTMFVINNSEKTPISNLIISDEYIDPDENIFRVSARSESSWFMEHIDNAYQRTFEYRDDWGKYADFGEIELIELNPKILYSAVGKDEKILCMAVISDPAYYTGSEIAAQLKEKNPSDFSNIESSKANCYVINGKGDDYNRIDYPAQNLSSDTSAVMIQYLPLTSDTTFANLNGWNVGWRVELGSA